ncbi:MAG TPA: hypothetical protein VJ022_15820, partial [Anaerolineales bacterium]|nr:hypothetical protein [Anaerolineales bacterium]
AGACAPATEPAVDPDTLPPDTIITSPPVIDPIGTESPNLSTSPNPSDAKLERGNVFISKSGLLVRESFPVQIALVLSGELPTPCHQLRVNVDPPDNENKIHVEVYSVFDPNVTCIQVLKPFQESVPLGSFPTGHYTVWVNDAQGGEFDT